MNSRAIEKCSFVVVLSVLTLTGCSQREAVDPTTAIAIGTTSVDGKPASGAMLTLSSVDDPRKRATGFVRMDGTFRVAGSPIGTCKVILDTSDMKMRSPEKYVPIPKKYQNLSTTNLEIELKPGKNEGLELKIPTS